ncbi:hypothetical protein KR074_002969 [Drosophila pseudoananassae]|nr:hypothetical protein KR074_002969 [Drosophila pseudoananassae]
MANTYRRGRDDSSDDENMELVIHPCKRRRLLPSRVKMLHNETPVDTFGRLMNALSIQNGCSMELKLEDLSYFFNDKLVDEKLPVLRILASCVIDHPAHSSAYATFVGLLNIGNFQFGAECVHYMMKKLHTSMEKNHWKNCYGIMAFIVDLFNCNVITCNSLISLLTCFLCECVEVEEGDDISDITPQARRDWLAFCVLSTLPSVGKELQQKSANFQSLLLTLQIYVKKRIPLHAAMLGVWNGGSGCAQMDYLYLLWEQVRHLHDQDWLEPEHHLILRPYLAFDDTLSAALQHVLPPLEMPAHSPTSVYPPARVVFRIFDFSTCPEGLAMPPILSVERHLLEVQILEILKVHHLERKLCADHLWNYAKSKPLIPVHFCIVEVILGKMLHLPTSKWTTLEYGSILVELSKLQPDKIPMAVMEAADIIFAQLEYMRVACFDRLVNFFSHYLNNFSFNWHWSQWGRECKSASAPNSTLNFISGDFQFQAVFLRELIKKCRRLSYHENMLQVLPENMLHFLPPPPLSHFKYIDERMPGAKLSQLLLEAMRGRRAEPSEISSILGTSITLHLLKINVLTQTCLQIGSKSFTHTFATLTRYESVFKLLIHNESEQHATLKGVFEVWAGNEHFKYVVVEKLIRMQIVEAKYVVSWIFTPVLRGELTKMYIWEILHATIRTVMNPVRLLPQKRSPEKTRELELELDEMNDTEVAVKGILLNILQRIVKVLESSIPGSEGSNTRYWFEWVQGRMQEFLFIYSEDFKKMASKLLKICDESDLPKSSIKVIQAYLAYSM